MKKILIVDDENKIRELIKLNLELAGYNCIEAVDGDEAIKKIEENPDLVLLDIMLPGKDGYEISKKFVEKNIPIIFLTAKDSTLDKVSGLKLGAEDYIVKPFETLELLARIEVVLRRYNKEDDIFKYNNIEINFKERIVTKDSEIVEL
ncbi:MAG: response regulator [Clostridia bacterium]|nr:response regulator [Clostridia bacterium]